ncbi:shikimate kinase [Campylobacter sp. MIT 97-5078]|uniref:shikimate kinase n=1 Tax=Campylobacter sp. MIT 97-5078 TaxID=1548153 RepID=UPI00051354AF|nr:shikimate kinase [Campylobacter sp. MIT 97-5078]KGI55802.1 hypothetical protein LR59_10415 [Campylobacter sp. MIT 97-5078]KGI57635.1 hypothetical protein LR59_02815 [Campylobacter sp. MIT 97-5078]TQR26901.1 shikimate kinase [Campylobacter sp. MIT 97-5078]
MKHNIILIGFMGCGKSTIAKALAKKLNYKLLDTDAFIEQKNRAKIKEIFENKGEEFFRNEEKALAQELHTFKNYIIATGGGFHKALLKDNNQYVVYLKAHFNYIKTRLSKTSLEKRPLFKDEKKARTLYKERLAEYESKANLTINTEHKSVLQIVTEIMKGYK